MSALLRRHATAIVGHGQAQAVAAPHEHQTHPISLGVAGRVDQQLSADTQQQRVMATNRFAVENDLGPKTPSTALTLSYGGERFPQPDVLKASGMQVEDLASQLINRVI